MSQKVVQDTVTKESVLQPPRNLDHGFRVNALGEIVSEKEHIEHQQRLVEIATEQREKVERKTRWAGRSHADILAMEVARIRPGIQEGPTFSITRRYDGALDVHWDGRVFRVKPEVVRHSDSTLTWHITAQGAMDRLATATVRPDAPRSMKQADVYEEQADLLRNLAEEAGVLDDPALQKQLEHLTGLGESATRWKMEGATLFLAIKTKIGDLRAQCLTLQAQLAQSQAAEEKAAAPKPKRSRPKPGTWRYASAERESAARTADLRASNS